MSALSKTAKGDKRMLETLKVETVEALERLRIESEQFAKKITDAGQHDIMCLILRVDCTDVFAGAANIGLKL